MSINEEYKIWKKNASFLYDSVLCHTLEWPSLTVQWLSHKWTTNTDNSTMAIKHQQLLLGTQTSGQDYEYLLVVENNQPIYYTEKRTHIPKVRVVKKIPHKGEVYRVRAMPQNEDVVATKGQAGIIALYDVSRTDDRYYMFKLTGHSKEGYGLSWSPVKKGLIASCGEDNLVCVWQIDFKKWGDFGPLRTFGGFEKDLEDISFNCYREELFVLVGDDGVARIYDLRSDNNPVMSVQAHKAAIFTTKFNPFHEHLFATGGADNLVKIWDYRKLSLSLSTLEHHEDEVVSLDWSRSLDGLLLSGSLDRRVMIWDMKRIGTGQTMEEALDGPPELLFVHAGHTTGVNDVSWNPADHEEWSVASTAANNVLQIWEPVASVHDEEIMKNIPTDELENAEIDKEVIAHNKLYPDMLM